MFRGVVLVRQNNLYPMLAKILIKGWIILLNLLVVVSIILKEACVILSMGASRI